MSMIGFLRIILGYDQNNEIINYNPDDPNLTNSDPDFMKTLQTYANQRSESVQPNEFQKLNDINNNFNNLIQGCNIDFKKDIDEARHRLLLPFCNDHEDLDASNSFLNTLIMNRWFDYLSRTYSNDANNFYIANIHSHWGKKYLDDLANGILQSDKDRLKNAKIIFWPLCEGGHWYLLTIKHQDDTFLISSFDGNNYIKFHDSILSIGKKLVEILHGTEHANGAIMKKWIIPPSNTDFDCGVVICYGADRICNGHQPSFKIDTDFCSYTNFRLTIANALSLFNPDEFINGYTPQGRKNPGISCKIPSITTPKNEKRIKV